MAKISLIQREFKRQRLVLKYEKKRTFLKKKSNELLL
jgi:hypothetical protein